MKSVFLIVFVTNLCNAQTNPIAFSRNQWSQAIAQGNNDVLINVDRLTSSLESRILHIVRRENGAVTQHLKLLDQAVASLKTDIAAVHTLSEVVRDLSFPDPGNNVQLEEKFTKVDALLNTIIGSVHKLEKDIKKNHRSKNTGQHQQPHLALIANPNDYDSGIAACSANDPNHLTGIRKIRRNCYAFCDMSSEEESDGWIIIQNRFSGEIDFFRTWVEYKIGFGNIFGEFWMGLDKIHELTSSTLHELLISMEDFEGNEKTARYSAFAISDESSFYTLNILGSFIGGEAGDSLKYHAGNKFSTYDNDNDDWADGNCARSHLGGWWYKSCDKSNLNGRYFKGGDDPQANSYQGVYWNTFSDGLTTSLKSVKMMIRPVEP